MSLRIARTRLFGLLLLLTGLILTSLLSGEPAHVASAQATTITVAMSNPTCVEAVPSRGTCSLQFGYLVASGSDPSFSRVEVLVNGKLRLVMHGFFEASAYLTDPMLPGGLIVACGSSNAGGNPIYGKSYLLAANAYMADGTSASDSDSVFCPPFDGRTFLPFQHH